MRTDGLCVTGLYISTYVYVSYSIVAIVLSLLLSSSDTPRRVTSLFHFSLLTTKPLLTRSRRALLDVNSKFQQYKIISYNVTDYYYLL